METSNREVRVMEGERLLQVWECPETTLPDGAAAVLWRGSPYRLLPGNRIDIVQEQPPAFIADQSCAMMPDDEMTWVLISGAEARLLEIRRRLEAGGVRVRRTGRWLGEDAGAMMFDWFICCEASPAPDLVATLLQSAMAHQEEGMLARLRSSPRPPAPAAPHSHAERDAVSGDDVLSPPEAGVGGGPELADALSRIEALTAELDTLRARSRMVLPAPTLRVVEELKACLAATRPDVVLLRDSWQVLAGEFTARDGFWRAVGELPADGSRPDGWKSLRAADKVWERHVSNGRDDTGRAYARFDTGARRWGVLLGWKLEQGQDIAWLKRQA
jgi:hypothetical protein